MADGNGGPLLMAVGNAVSSPFSFTCLLPVCRRDDPHLLHQALSSIAASDLRPTLTIVCEDGELTAAQDTVLAAIRESFSFERIRNPGPPGLHNNLNHALRHVSTPWLCRADADDVNLSSRFAEQAQFLQANPQITVLGCDITEVWPDGSSRIKRMPEHQAEILRWAVYRNPINHMTAFVRTGALRDCGGYPAIPLKEDYALWLRLLSDGHAFANLPQPLVRVHLGADFYKRRSGMKNIASEAQLHRFRAALSGTGRTRALGIALVRMLALAGAPLAVKHIYETRLR